MSSTIDQRPPGPGSEDPTGRFTSVPGPFHRPGPGPSGHPYPQYRPQGPYAGQVPPGPVVPGAPLPPQTGSLRGRTVFGIAGAIVLLLLVIGSAVSANRTTTVPGSVTLHVTYSSLTPGSSCTGAGYTSWLQSDSTPVTIYDASGAVVGTTTIGSGTAYSSGNGGSSSYADTCVFPFTLTDVPAHEDFYRVKAGTGSDDGVTFTGEQVRSGGAHIEYGGNRTGS